jgi:hypothetical protein
MRILWRRHDTKHKIVYQAYTDIAAEPRGFERGLNESDMDPIQAWCVLHRCGQRISFDLFQFVSMDEVTLFMLRWS